MIHAPNKCCCNAAGDTIRVRAAFWFGYGFD
jgi:hypothetical protein